MHCHESILDSIDVVENYMINDIHKFMFIRLFSELDRTQIKSVLDVRTGRISLTLLCSEFPDAKIDAMIADNGVEKGRILRDILPYKNYNLLFYDIKSGIIDYKYDLVVVHVLSQSVTDKDEFCDVFKRFTPAMCDYLVVIDYTDSSKVDLKLVRKHLHSLGYLLVADQLSIGCENKSKELTGMLWVSCQ